MRIILASAAVAMLIACAPEPTTPSSASLAGTWTSGAHLFSLSNMRMTLVQEPEGIVSGTWFARDDGGAGGCAGGAPCDVSGSVIGRSTVAQVEIEFLGAGRFEGAQLEENRLRGIFAVAQSYDTITFIRNAQ